jgi:ATP-dependent DNA ligase
MLAEQTPAAFVAFDLLALDDESYVDRPFGDRRAALEPSRKGSPRPVHLTPSTTDRALAMEWFDRFEGRDSTV